MKRDIKKYLLVAFFVIVGLLSLYSAISLTIGFTPNFILKSSQSTKRVYYSFVTTSAFFGGMFVIAALIGCFIGNKMKKDEQKTLKYGEYAIAHLPEGEFYPKMDGCNNVKMQKQLIENAQCTAKVEDSKIRIEISTMVEIAPEDIYWFRDNFEI